MSRSPADTMVVENGKIKYVGAEAGSDPWFRAGVTKVIDLKGKTVLPG